MNILNASIPVYTASGGVDLVLETEEFGIIPFHAVSTSPEGSDSYQLYHRAVAGDFGEIAPYIESEEIKLQSLKNDAAEALIKSDITVIRCAENSVPVTVEWKEYRESLRALANLESWADGLVCPPVPENYPPGS